MKPTQQEIIDLAREHATRYTNRHYPDKPVFTFTQDALQKVIELALERFGAGGGEPSRDMPHGWVTNWPAPNGGTRPVYHASAIKPKYGPELDSSLVSYPVFTRPGPSPSDLRAEYLRGLDDAKKIASNYGPSRPIVTNNPSQRVVGRWEGEQAASAGIADAIEALKGKQ